MLLFWKVLDKMWKENWIMFHTIHRDTYENSISQARIISIYPFVFSSNPIIKSKRIAKVRNVEMQYPEAYTFVPHRYQRAFSPPVSTIRKYQHSNHTFELRNYATMYIYELPLICVIPTSEIGDASENVRRRKSKIIPTRNRGRKKNWESRARETGIKS